MKLRIDFSVREADVPPEDARGVRFGDDIDVKQIFDFFNKCRDAILTLFNQRVPVDPFADERQRLEAEIAKLRVELKNRDLERMKPRSDPGVPCNPRDPLPWEYRPGRDKHWIAEQIRALGDDGSRGGDGPPDPEYLKKVAEITNPDRNRY